MLENQLDHKFLPKRSVKPIPSRVVGCQCPRETKQNPISDRKGGPAVTSTYMSWLKKEHTPKVAFKDHSKPKVEEKGMLITNARRVDECHLYIANLGIEDKRRNMEKELSNFLKELPIRQAYKLFTISTISKDYSREQLGYEKEQVCEVLDLPPMVGPTTTVASRLLGELILVDNTLRNPVACTLQSPPGTLIFSFYNSYRFCPFKNSSIRLAYSGAECEMEQA
ncbi:hypothetical protein M9H77_34352 [Catharanthus roseus]|uniref:Uncharacterized protein n=1 Tax=Catharanthus roseus TaxID=4058 RepID=A0ACB9ZQ60_CATRO|nr:hypothetical protein M9H77_34352 [Catharanthus roseus]